MGSRRETLIQNVVSRLEAIKTGASYHNKGKLKSVQRYIHQWEDEGHITNLLASTPTVIVRVVEENTSADVVDEWKNSITLDLWWVVIGSDWNCDDANAALEDMKRALFVGKDIGFGVNATEPEMRNQMLDAKTGAPMDGLHLTLTVTYKEELGSPELGD